MNNFFRKENINVYVIEHTTDKPTKLDRGDKIDINPEDKLSKKYLFFTPEKGSAEQYGNVSEFETTKPLRVVALDDITDDFFNYASEEVQKYLVSNYGHNTNDKLRNTNESGDFAVSQYICDQGYDGYAIDTMDTDAGGKFHQEIVICNPSVNVKFVGEVEDEEHKRKIKETELQKRLNPQRKKRSIVSENVEDANVPMSLSGTLFDDMITPEKSPSKQNMSDTPHSVPKLSFGDAFDSPPSTPRGGAKRVSKMKKTKGKRKRRTKRRRQ